MNVILLTIFIGLVLVFLFIALFFQYFCSRGAFSPDRESLLPLEADSGYQGGASSFKASTSSAESSSDIQARNGDLVKLTKQTMLEKGSLR